ncbi:hypothetical protein CYMTET_39694 [Cymbomonas tetramitiformis]|uniref:Uncharacterized protein n=1 Tax=Cymbomonas tetramitiformis TaxID=36881 RepID=A0AAE0CB04_9CHLO|nr:hypothetical protein CYMTET_39694 [Cymbomonas tetramitiformis]
MMEEAAEEHDRRMWEALKDLLPGGKLAPHSLECATLPHGMGLTKATSKGEQAESDLPYVWSVQRAMRKAAEAMGEIETARRAEKYLPPQVPKADDVKKSSDLSSSQRRAQRVYAAVLHSADWLTRLARSVGQSRLP